MPTISEIYEQYRIMPGLQEHQLKVAAVAGILSEAFNPPRDTDTVVRACLLHDMGNIIKFRLGDLPDLLEPKGLAYWNKVQDEMVKRYGHDEHKATLKIAREIGASSRVLDCIDAVGFLKTTDALRLTAFEPKICHYADHRVAPYGVVTLEERITDGRKRYEKKSTLPIDQFEVLVRDSFMMEQQILAHTQFSPSDITEKDIAPLVKELRSYTWY